MKLINMALSNMAEDGEEIVADVGYSSEGLAHEKSESKSEPKKEGPDYPYCLKLYLGPDEVKKLALSQMPALGSSLEMMAKVMVVGQRLDDNNMTLELQITDMGLDKPAAPMAKKSAVEALYGGQSKES